MTKMVTFKFGEIVAEFCEICVRASVPGSDSAVTMFSVSPCARRRVGPEARPLRQIAIALGLALDRGFLGILI